MGFRSTFSFLAFSATVIAQQPTQPEQGEHAAKPNVIIVLADDQGYGDMSCLGNPALKTPNLDRLHAQSLRLSDFHTSPICSPSRAMLLTGVDAMRSGAFGYAESREIPRREFPTMAELFAANGYRTGLFGKWHLGENYPYRPQDRGFQEIVRFGGAHIAQTNDAWNNDCFDGRFLHNGKLQQYPGFCGDVWFDEAMRFAQECQRKEQPFFIFLPTNAPHGPLMVPDKYYRQYVDGKRGDHTARFLGMLANLDENMGRLERFLSESGLEENTILIYMSDNGTAGGEAIFNAGMKGSKWSYYEGGHREPCFIRWPAGKLRSPGDISELTQIQDILPTLSDLCGLVDPKGATFDGVSLAPLLEGKPQDLSGRNLVVQVTTGSQAKKWECAVMADKWRLINGKELYNIEKDPGQKQDIADKNPEMVERLTKAYEKWWAELEPLSREPAVIPVGNEHENPVHLTCYNWFGVEGKGGYRLQDDIRKGSRVNGAWRLEVEQAGEYEIVLSRWPREIDVPITSGMPSYQSVDIKFAENNNWLPEGKALPITQARMQVGPLERSQAISPTDTTISFTVSLKKGPTKLQTWFDDRTGKPICGAYYVEVRRKNGEVDSLND
jgi:arylsulfatase A-like enzyme